MERLPIAIYAANFFGSDWEVGFVIVGADGVSIDSDAIGFVEVNALRFRNAKRPKI